MSFGSQKSNTTTTMDPQIKGALLDVFETGKQVAAQPYQSYEAPRVAPFSPFQLQSIILQASLPVIGSVILLPSMTLTMLARLSKKSSELP